VFHRRSYNRVPMVHLRLQQIFRTDSKHKKMRSFALAALILLGALPLCAQENYEIQVYGSETVQPGITMGEIHSNFTFKGSKSTEDGQVPTNHALHETLEITHGFNNWFETGFYVFTSYNPKYGYGWVGDHIRPRVRVPESWKWPVGASLSVEFGYQRAKYNGGDNWNIEFRPIIDKELGKLYLAFNPAIERTLHGPGVHDGLGFAPAFKAGYDVSKVVNAGIEYYGSLGSFTGFDSPGNQEHQIIPAIDLNFSKNWEFNAGVGVGVTHATDHLLVKFILGRRFEWGRRKS